MGQVLKYFAIVAVGAAFSAAVAQTVPAKPDMSCAFFSPKADDTKGPPILFYADLSADEESAVTESPGRGRADFVLDRATLNFTWKVTYKDLTSRATGLRIHGPGTPGGEAGILIDMAPKGMTPMIEGSSVLNEGLLAYLVQDRMYVNLVTTTYPNGELRAPIRKARPTC